MHAKSKGVLQKSKHGSKASLWHHKQFSGPASKIACDIESDFPGPAYEIESDFPGPAIDIESNFSGAAVDIESNFKSRP